MIDLSGFTGTENYYLHPLARTVTYTDGVQHFAEGAGAYWFLDILATEVAQLMRRKKEDFIHIKMLVKDRGAKITADDGNDNVLWSKDILFTDCPEGEWRFYMAPGGPNNSIVIMLPSEY
jgi:hypothetical protein